MDDLDAVLESDTSDNFRQLILSFQPPEVSSSAPSAPGDRRKHAFDGFVLLNPGRDVTDYPKFKNDHGSPEIQIGVKEFKCIGVAAPHDHPHVYLNMGAADSILCPYCGTRFRYNAGLGSGAIPVDSVVEADL